MMLNELTNLVNRVNFLLTYMSIENDIVSNNNNQCHFVVTIKLNYQNLILGPQIEQNL